MTVLSARRRTLRTAVASAALGAALLGSASGAFAATPGTAATAAAAKPASDGAGRYAGQPVYIGNGMVAVLRNVRSAGGPEAWIRYVGPQWKPGDWYLVRVLDVLDSNHRSAQVKGLSLRLSGTSGTSPKLHVGGGKGGAKTYALPKSGAPATGGKETGKSGQGGKGTGQAARKPGGTASDGRKSCTVSRRVAIGGGTLAVMSNSSKGPRVTFEDGPGNAVPGASLDRTHPTLARFGAKIVDPYSARPTFRFKMQGGSYPAGHANFPTMPKGCALVAKPGASGVPGGTHAAKAAGSKAAAAPGSQAAPTATQTKVLPKGAVAAGYDGAEAPDNTPLFAAGGALAAAGAAGVAFAVRRRRQSEGARA
ncbi:hypothetical protein ACH4OW_38510 [Streptomyces sp. NPDC017056]|uniref:hypothetical protein n=1 Tax=Streptomyces sp. NPDC017056 TaxID=3364973 RepID=UPI00379C0DA1